MTTPNGKPPGMRLEPAPDTEADARALAPIAGKAARAAQGRTLGWSAPRIRAAIDVLTLREAKRPRGAARPSPSSGSAPPPQDDPRPRVERGQDVHRVIEDLETALATPDTGDPRLFQREGELVIVRGVTAEDAKRLRIAFLPDAVVIAPLRAPTLLARITEHVNYGSWGFVEKQDESGEVYRQRAWKRELPAGTVLGALLDKPFWGHVRKLRGISVTPIIHLADGSIVSTGYDPASQFLVASNITLPPIPEAPDREQARAALAELVEPFDEFLYETEDERYSPVAQALTHLLGPELRGNRPGYVHSAPQKNCGKSLTGKAPYLLATGRIPAANTWPKDEVEQEKIIGSAAEAGSDVLFFDNVDPGAIVGGAALDKVLTCDGANGFRVLGRSELKRLPWNATVIFTVNRGRIGGDSDRRLVHDELVRRDTPIEYRHEDLLAYVAAERPRLLAAAFTLVRAWVLAGKPREDIRRLDSFEHWAWTVASMIKWAGGGNVRELVRDVAGTDADAVEAALLGGLRDYLERTKRQDVTVAALVAEVCAVRHGPEFQELREAIETIGGFEGKGEDRKLDVRRFGRRLAAMKNVLQGGYRLRLAGATAGRSRWTVEVGGSGGSRGVHSNLHAGGLEEERGLGLETTPLNPPDPPREEGDLFADYLSREGIGEAQ